MRIKVLPATVGESTTMRHLFQFYLYEFSRYLSSHTTRAGLFYDDDLEGCWTDPKRHPFLFQVEGQWAGLAIVDTLPKSRYSNRTNIAAMSEFFIMAAYQGHGYGREAARFLFNEYPGKWEAFQLAQNHNARAFWRKVIGEITTYEEVEYGEARHTVQFFET